MTDQAEQLAAANVMWGSVGRDYDDISFSVIDALCHGAMRLNPQPGEAVLDVATGTGLSARNAARFGAQVTGIDISEGLLAAAAELSAHIEPPITYRHADAAALPFEDATFDRVISTFGVMFAPDQQGAASELARVAKPGARLVVVAWSPGGTIDDFFNLLGRYQDGPPPDGPSPMNWGTREGAAELLGGEFDLVFEDGTNHGRFDDGEHAWTFYQRTFGPVRVLAEALPADRLAALRQDFIEEHAQHATEAGISIPRDYLVTVATRR